MPRQDAPGHYSGCKIATSHVLLPEYIFITPIVHVRARSHVLKRARLMQVTRRRHEQFQLDYSTTNSMHFCTAAHRQHAVVHLITARGQHGGRRHRPRIQILFAAAAPAILHVIHCVSSSRRPAAGTSAARPAARRGPCGRGSPALGRARGCARKQAVRAERQGRARQQRLRERAPAAHITLISGYFAKS